MVEMFDQDSRQIVNNASTTLKDTTQHFIVVEHLKLIFDIPQRHPNILHSASSIEALSKLNSHQKRLLGRQPSGKDSIMNAYLFLLSDQNE